MPAFGPIGLLPDQRVKALGAALLAINLAQQAEEGVAESDFLWGEPQGPALNMYTRAGFLVNWVFHLLERRA